MFLLLLAACTPKDGETDPSMENSPPEPALVAITPPTPTTADPLQVVVQGGASDPDGDAVTLRYAWFVDGADAGQAGETVPAEATAKGETWRVVVTPSDGALDGEAAYAEVTVVNTPPTTTVALEPADATTADEVTATAEGTDADADPITYTWAWTVDGADAGIAAPTLPPGTHRRGEVWQVTATPSDDEAAGAPATASFTVTNALPSLDAVVLTPDAPTVSDTLTASFADPGDADDDAVVVLVSWQVDGVEVATDEVDADGTATLTGLWAKGQVVRIVATPFDGYGEGAPVEATVLAADSAPAATSATISPSPLTTADDVTCTGAGWTDPDGDPEGWQTTWTINGAIVSNAAVLPAGTHTRGDVVGCTLVPDDGELTGEAVEAAPVTVTNAAPTCASVGIEIGPDPATIADTLAITADRTVGCADADGDPLTAVYDWRVDGTSAGSGATLAGAFSRGQSVALTLGWSDGTVTAASATSNPVSIVNEAPAVVSLTITPSPAYTDDTLSTVVSASDLEGDAVSYRYSWTVDGVARSTDATLGGTAFVKGQAVAVTVTPTDGTDDGAPMTASLTIQNTAPTAPGVAISPTGPGDTDALVCALSAASDADGDAIAYTFAWTVGGVAYTSTTTTTFAGDTVPASATTNGQVWACTVTASDGTASASGSASVTVGCDRDGDGYDDQACGGTDCADSDPARNPGAVEVCDASDVDEDCDGLADDADPSLSGTTYYPDRDGDGYGDASGGVVACSRPSGYLTTGDDCNDASAQIRPGGAERCDSADVDEDCDGLADDADSSTTGKSYLYIDADGDGYGDETASSVLACAGLAGYATSHTDCNDADVTVSPAEAEVCDDGVDNNCDDAPFPCGVTGAGDDTDAWHVIQGQNTGFGADIATGDFNGDGARDIASAAYTYDRFSLFYGPFPDGTDVESNDDVRWVVANDYGLEIAGLGDVNADGYDDLAALATGTTSSVYLIEGGPTLADTTVSPSSAILTFGYYGEVAGAGDFDADGIDDFWVSDNGTSTSLETDTLSLYSGDPSGPTLTASWTNAGGYWAYHMATGEDWDGDGIDDLVATMYGPPSAVLFLPGETSPAGGALTATADGWIAIDTSAGLIQAPFDVDDFDGDGYRDVAVTTYTTSYRTYLFQGPPGSGVTVADAWAYTNGSAAAAGDLDDDGDSELFIGNQYLLSRYEYPLPSGALGTATGSLNLSSYYTPYIYELEAGTDYTGDNVGDLMFSLYSGSSAEGVYVFAGGNP